MSEDITSERQGQLEFPDFYDDIDPDIAAEFELAQREARQPNCIYCGHPLEIGQTFYTDLRWEWNTAKCQYQKLEDRDADCNKPYCLNCEVRDWDFTNNRWVQY
jgi:hypothetical protein